MIKRTIDISSGPARLRVENEQLVVAREGLEDARVPCEDLGILLIDQRETVYTHSVLTRLMQNGACVVLCDEKHLPCGLVLPVEGNELVTQRLRKQIEVSRPLEKRLWRDIVKAKVLAQAGALEAMSNRETVTNMPSGAPAPLGMAPVRKLRNLAGEVLSGDPTNVEGQAARIYWEALLGEEFKRAREGAWPNAILNYGYAVVRASVARAIVGAGLHPSFGLHHHNRGNAFCLADDLVEPLRPLVDAAVVGLLKAGETEITPANKRVMLGLLVWEVEVGEAKGPLMVQLHRVAASLWGCYAGEREEMELPRYGVGKLMEGSARADQ